MYAYVVLYRRSSVFCEGRAIAPPQLRRRDFRLPRGAVRGGHAPVRRARGGRPDHAHAGRRRRLQPDEGLPLFPRQGRAGDRHARHGLRPVRRRAGGGVGERRWRAGKGHGHRRGLCRLRAGEPLGVPADVRERTAGRRHRPRRPARPGQGRPQHDRLCRGDDRRRRAQGRPPRHRPDVLGRRARGGDAGTDGRADARRRGGYPAAGDHADAVHRVEQ